jgi:UDP-2,3-diacylglucosamine hydrolase
MTAKAGKYYFVSDLHLGVPDPETSLKREKQFVSWLEMVSKDAQAIFILGDLFDFWHEYKTVVPKGFVRSLAAIARITDAGIPVYLFHGNHDMWMDEYLSQETGVQIVPDRLIITLEGKSFFLAHGDGLGPGDRGYKLLKKVFRNPVCRWLFRWLHPDIGTRIAAMLSYKSRFSQGAAKQEHFKSVDEEWLFRYVQQKIKTQPCDYYLFGHRHLPLELPVEQSFYINTGDWISYYSYAVFDGERCELRYFTHEAD